MEGNKLIENKKDKTLVMIIAGLGIVLVVLFIFFMVERSANRKHIAEIHQEKELLEQELTDLSSNYDNLKTSNDTLNEKLSAEQEKIATLLDEMKKFRDNSYAEINRYKKEIGTLKTVLRSYVVQIDSLNQLNQKLTAENTQVKKQISWVRERNNKLGKRTEKHAGSHCPRRSADSREFCRRAHQQKRQGNQLEEMFPTAGRLCHSQEHYRQAGAAHDLPAFHPSRRQSDCIQR